MYNFDTKKKKFKQEYLLLFSTFLHIHIFLECLLWIRFCAGSWENSADESTHVSITWKLTVGSKFQTNDMRNNELYFTYYT